MTESSTSRTTDEEPQLRLYGGPWATLVPILVFIGVMFWLSIEERASVTGFWVGGWAALAAGLLLVRTKRVYAEAIIRGMTDRTGVVVIVAFMFAGVFGALMSAGGLVDGLLWFGLETGVQGAMFTVVAFLLACIFAVGTGTSVGTVVAMVPVLYPAGVLLGADPLMLAVAILAGGAFGDNLAPISDTTIASAFTQDADMGDVVRSRLRLSLSAAAISVIVLAIFGGGGEVADDAGVGADTEPIGLIMLIPFAIVIYSALRKRHIVESLLWGSLSGIVLGLITGQIEPSELFSMPAERGESTGVIEDGLANVTAAVLFVLFILALTQILSESGVIARLLAWLETRAVRGVRSAELTIVGASLVFTVPLGANAPAILLLGPSIAKPLGARYNLSPARRANLLDCAVCTVFYMLSWHNAVIVWFSTLEETASEFDITSPSIFAAFANPYAWALLVVLVFSAITGWGRTYTPAK